MVDPGAALSILFYGGSGVISAACVREAVAAGHRVSVLNRGQTRSRMLPEGIELLQADVRDSGAVAHALGERRFDVVADFLAFHPDNVAQSLEQVRGRVGHYVFISSASAYQTPPARLPVTESTPLRNPMWDYSRNKIACEDLLVRRYRDEGLPMTIVRPSHTYDETSPPLFGGWTTVERLLRGAPVVVPGDGTSLWTVTHARDVARGFVPLLGNPAGVGADLVHVASDTLCAARPELTGPLLGDMANSMLFDNTKARLFAPEWHARTTFAQGAREIIRWRREHTPQVDHDLDAYFDQLVARVR